MTEVYCPICEKKDEEFLFYNWDRLYKVDKKRFRIVKCRECGLIYLSPQPDKKELLKYYPEEKYHAYQETKTGKKYFKKSRKTKTILDVGCATGGFLEDFLEKNPEWSGWGVEPSKKAAKIAAGKGIKVKNGYIEEVKFSKNFFDFVRFNHTLEHAYNPGKALKVIHHSLKPGGSCFIKLPNVKSLGAKIFGRWWFGWDTPRHLFHFEKKTLVALLEKEGFKVKKISFHLSPFWLPTEILFFVTKKYYSPFSRWILLLLPLCLLPTKILEIFGLGLEFSVLAKKV